MDNGVALAAIALVGTILAVVVKPLFALLRANTRATSANTIALQSIAKETKRGADEAKHRNGHLAELIVESKKATLDAIQNVPAQHVDLQKVDKQVVKQ